MDYSMNDLIDIFNDAKEFKANFVAIRVSMDGFPSEETIINESENVDSKLDYYRKTYDENLNHKYSKGIKITAFTYGDTFEEIRRSLA